MPDDLPIINTKDAIERMGDNDLYLEIAHYFANNLPHVIADLGQALDASNMHDATRISHSLKSNCATVGAEATREKCAHLEMLCKNNQPAEAKAAFVALKPELLALQTALLSL